MTRVKILDSTSSTFMVARNDDADNPMLPCEFCEGMIPMRKLLEHQVQNLFIFNLFQIHILLKKAEKRDIVENNLISFFQGHML